MIFKVMILDGIIKGGRVDKDEKIKYRGLGYFI